MIFTIAIYWILFSLALIPIKHELYVALFTSTVSTSPRSIYAWLFLMRFIFVRTPLVFIKFFIGHLIIFSMSIHLFILKHFFKEFINSINSDK